MDGAETLLENNPSNKWIALKPETFHIGILSWKYKANAQFRILSLGEESFSIEMSLKVYKKVCLSIHPSIRDITFPLLLWF